VVWEGRSREASPYPDQWHFSEVACVLGDVRSSGQSRLDPKTPTLPSLTGLDTGASQEDEPSEIRNGFQTTWFADRCFVEAFFLAFLSGARNSTPI
jgi:hypothetical protein